MGGAICTTADGSGFTWGRGAMDSLLPSQVGGELRNRAVVQVAAGHELGISTVCAFLKMVQCTLGEKITSVSWVSPVSILQICQSVCVLWT